MAPTAHTSTARLLGGASILAAPLLVGIADQVRMAAEPPAELGGVDSDFGVEAATANLASVAEHPGTFAAASWLLYAGMLVSVPALVALWRLSVTGAPRWAWAGAGTAALGVLGVMGQFVAYYGIVQVLATQPDLAAAAALDLEFSAHPFALGIFGLVLMGFLGTVLQAVALRRAGVVPLWAAAAVVAGTVLHLVLGSTPPTSAVWTLLLLAGSAPAAAAVLRRRSLDVLV